LNRVPWRAEHRTAALRPLAACKSPLLQVAVAAFRGGAILELPSRNQPRVADRHRDGDDQSASMNHRLKSGQSKAAFLAVCSIRRSTRSLPAAPRPKASATTFTWGGRLWRGGGSQRLSRSVGRRGIVRRLAPRRSSPAGRDSRQKVAGPKRRCGRAVGAISHLVRAAQPRQTAMCAGLNAAIGSWSNGAMRTRPPIRPRSCT